MRTIFLSVPSRDGKLTCYVDEANSIIVGVDIVTEQHTVPSKTANEGERSNLKGNSLVSRRTQCGDATKHGSVLIGAGVSRQTNGSKQTKVVGTRMPSLLTVVTACLTMLALACFARAAYSRSLQLAFPYPLSLFHRRYTRVFPTFTAVTSANSLRPRWLALSVTYPFIIFQFNFLLSTSHGNFGFLCFVPRRDATRRRCVPIK